MNGNCQNWFYSKKHKLLYLLELLQNDTAKVTTWRRKAIFQKTTV